jgi:uncharacterized membrane-anchored protein YjiN (DUF445 family)
VCAALPAPAPDGNVSRIVISVLPLIDPLGIGRQAARRVADAMVTAAVRSGVAERATAELLDSGALDRILERTLDSPLPQHVIDDLLAGGIAEDVAERILSGPELGRIMDSPAMEQFVARIVASEQLWLVVEEVARSPVVTEAISHQGVGFAEQVVDDVGERSRRADVWLERVAQRMLHRMPPAGAVPGAPATP